jgi:hypothetical protein
MSWWQNDDNDDDDDDGDDDGDDDDDDDDGDKKLTLMCDISLVQRQLRPKHVLPLHPASKGLEAEGYDRLPS